MCCFSREDLESLLRKAAQLEPGMENKDLKMGIWELFLS